MEYYLEEFIKYMSVIRNYSDYTIDNYVHDINVFNEYLIQIKISYKCITYNDISKYIKHMKEMNEAPTSINRNLSSLRSFYNYLLKEGIIKSNPFNLVKSLKKPLRLPNYMKYNEFEVMINTCDDTPLGNRDKALLETLLATGARIGEIVNIKLSDIDLNNSEIKVLGKGNKERICYLNNYAVNSLKSYLNNSRVSLLKQKQSDFLFINNNGGALTTRGIRYILNKIITKSGLNIHVSPHAFRHTFATMLLNEGCDLKSVQELLGHANLSTTSIYTHLSNDRIKDAYLHAHPRSRG